MTTRSPFFRAYRMAFRWLYGIALPWGGWIIAHAGPLEPSLLKLGIYLHNKIVPHSYDLTMLNPIPVDGLRIYHNGHRLLAPGLAMGWYEPELTQLFKKLAAPGMTVLDVGANIGFFTLQGARLVGRNGKVWAFEPIPEVNELLQKSVKENGFEDRVHVLAQAVSNTSGIVRLHINAAETVLSSLYEDAVAHQIHEVPGQNQSVDVPCTTLDAWAASHNWPRVDLVKVDVEGSEEAVLEGMVELSRKNRQMKLFIEFNSRTLRIANATPEDFFAALHSCGFQRFFEIGEKLRLLDVASDVPRMMSDVALRGDFTVNLLCEK